MGGHRAGTQQTACLSTFILTNVEEITSRAPNAKDKVAESAYESLPHLEGCLGPWMVIREEVGQALHMLWLQREVFGEGERSETQVIMVRVVLA